MDASQEYYKEIEKLGFQTVSTAVDQSYAQIIAGKKGERIVFPTKWRKLNTLFLGGLQPGKLYVIAGRPGVGKSAFSNKMLFDILDHTKNQGRCIVLYWSFEMPGYQQLMRIGSAKSGRTMADLLSVHRELEDVSFEEYIKIMNPYKKYPIFFYNHSQSIANISKVI